jgi:hypothetical protein
MLSGDVRLGLPVCPTAGIAWRRVRTSRAQAITSVCSGSLHDVFRNGELERLGIAPRVFHQRHTPVGLTLDTDASRRAPGETL